LKETLNHLNIFFENKTRKYYPDFIYENGTYVEIKGYLNEMSKSKISQFKEPIILLLKEDMQYMFDYVLEKYGENFTDLYEK
jgi:hypothetical protein